jgi:hypothetical protein
MRPAGRAREIFSVYNVRIRTCFVAFNHGLTVSQGSTIESALALVQEATELYLEEFRLLDVDLPLLTTFEGLLPKMLRSFVLPAHAEFISTNLPTPNL